MKHKSDRKTDRNLNLTRSEIVLKNLSKLFVTFFEADETKAQMLAHKTVQLLTDQGISLKPRKRPWDLKRQAEQQQVSEAQMRYNLIEDQLKN